MLERALRDHTYALRAREVDQILSSARKSRFGEPSWALSEHEAERIA
jgi:hypothetical protein